MRFDFHYTTDGWRISEVNCDVPGGFVEASGFTRLMAAACPGLRVAGDPAEELVGAICARLSPGIPIALIFATAYTDDRQVMQFLARRFAEHEQPALLVSPVDVRWEDGAAWACDAGRRVRLGGIFRFFPAEWLPNLPHATGWPHYFNGSTPQCNPATALLTQSKRVPLVWDELGCELPTWRRYLPETRAVRDADLHSGEWVLKPALGRVGDSIGIAGVTSAREWQRIRRQARWWGRHWIAQRRFAAVPMASSAGSVYPCIGIYVIDGRAAGAYGRIAALPLINEQAQDAAVLVPVEVPRRDPAMPNAPALSTAGSANSHDSPGNTRLCDAGE